MQSDRFDDMRKKLTFAAVGDFLPQRRVPENSEGFAEVANFIQRADARFFNLETTFPDNTCFVNQFYGGSYLRANAAILHDAQRFGLNIVPFGNLYYVGDKKVCMHLVDTGDGLILFDTGFSHHYHGLLHSIKTLGFSPADIKIVIHSHGHCDHFGGGDRLRRDYGVTIYMSEVDNC